MSVQVLFPKVTLVQPVNAIRSVRQEWEETGEDLLTVQGSVALVLYDLCCQMAFTPDELKQALGEGLLLRLQGVL